MEPSNSDEPAHNDCRAISDVLARVGDKWTVMVVGLLSDGPMRFNELRRTIGGISQRMLTLTLRGLERDGLVTRTVFPTIPPRVDYALTDRGRTLIEPLKALFAWATEHNAAIEQSRKSFDVEKPGAEVPHPPRKVPALVRPRPAAMADFDTNGPTGR
ncbi:winged helix-turn-helix transcriptional regulator [Inquilinus sp. CA228]|uniref:winged helix-turn-helix transcriptional regulator n=1 Tax=Inquilinus sp. CA228 TaxID=3455609 RepID=UPI003F8D47D7